MLKRADKQRHLVKPPHLQVFSARTLFVMAVCAAAFLPVTSVRGEPYYLDAQDKLRIRVIEWRAGKSEYHEWTALGSEYQVGASGTISIPLLGELSVEGKTTEQVATTISAGLRQKAALVNPPDVSVEVIQFRPVYLVGAVERPGEYAYRPGLTVLKSIGMAGGLYRITEVGLLRLERDRITAVGAAEGAKLEIRRMLARRARLEAELAQADKITTPPELVNDDEAAALLAQETFIMQARSTALKSQLKALAELKQLYEKEAKSLAGRRTAQDQQVAVTRKELGEIGALVRKGLSPTSREFALERLIADLESKNLELETARLRAIQEAGKAQRDATDLHNDQMARTAIELRDTRASLEQLDAKLRTADELVREAVVIAPLKVLDRSASLRERPVFSIVRKSLGEFQELAADENTIVQPGDVIRVESNSSESVGSGRVSGVQVHRR